MDEPVRVLNLFTILDRGGAETMVMNYYRNIDRTKVQFDFLVHRPDKGAYEDEILSLGGRIFRIRPVRPWTATIYRHKIRDFFIQHPEYKIIHAHMSELGFYAFIEAKRAGIPIRISHAHASPHGWDYKTPIRWYYKTRMKSYVTDMLVCGYDSGCWLFGKNKSERFVQINNAIDAKKYSFDPGLREKIRTSAGIDDKTLLIGHVGRFVPPKNHEFLIEVFARVLQLIEAKLVLVGDGPLRSEIETKIKNMGIDENVFLTGVCDDVSGWLQAMDAFVFPSRFEGLSLATIEAQAAGLPCFISDKVSIECKKTDLLKQIPLSAGYNVWAEEIVKVKNFNRQNTYEEIKNSGFDVKQNAKVLQDYYLQRLGKK